MKRIITKISIVTLFFVAGIFTSSFSQKTVKVLFIGNSFTYVNDLPTTFKSLASAGGKTVTTDVDANGGQYFDAVNGAQPGHSLSSTTYTKIRSQAWDYVVLQDNQGYFAGYIHTIGSAYLAANMRLRDSVRAICPCARVIWFSGWCYMGGIPQQISGDNTVNMNTRIDSNYQYMNEKYAGKEEIIAPFGKAWNNEIKAQASIESLLFASDQNHPGVAGQLSNAAVLYTIIFKQDPSNINFNNGQTAANATLLRHTAYTTVMTPYILASHKISSITPSVTNNSGVLTVTGSYSAYQWYLNNVAISGATSSTYSPTTNGSYMVIATSTSNNCAQNWSFPIVVTATGIEESINNNNVVLYPNPVTSESAIELKDMEWEGCNIEIINMVGQVMQTQPLTSNTFHIHKSDFESGIYIYTITDRTGNKFIGKIQVM